MPIEIVVTDEYVQWWESLDEDEQISVRSVVDLLENLGVTLEFPYSTAIVQSRKLRELRVQHAGRPYRVLYAFDPARKAVLLVGGNKTGNDRWYEEYVPWAERIFADYLRETSQK
jgi:hypothetical protein